MSAPATLRNISVKKTCEMLKNGVWDTFRDNPFSFMPNSVVDQLLSSMWPSESAVDKVKIRHIRLLLTSDRLEHVDLTHTRDEGEYVTLLWMLSRGCQNLRSLTVLWGPNTTYILDKEPQVFEDLLQNCTKLEHLHSCLNFKPNALGNCRNLKTLRLHTDYVMTERFFRGVTSDFLNGFESIEVIARCWTNLFPHGKHEFSAAVTFLANCPQLTSLGALDSSMAVKELHDRDRGTSRRFQLRKCLWNIKKDISKPDYCDTIRVAALCCPLVAVLSIVVTHAAALQHLKTLMFLTCLDINLNSEYHFAQEFYSLLSEIGFRLQHLSVSTHKGPLSLNAITGKCPNLRTLQLLCEMTTDEGVRHLVNFVNLERLSLLKCDRKGLGLLLSNCLHLKMLFLSNCKKLNDDDIHSILLKNPFVELEIAVIQASSLSESGCTSFVQSAVKLNKCYIQSYRLSNPEVRRCVRNVNPSVDCHIYNVRDLEDQQFFRAASKPCWL